MDMTMFEAVQNIGLLGVITVAAIIGAFKLCQWLGKNVVNPVITAHKEYLASQATTLKELAERQTVGLQDFHKAVKALMQGQTSLLDGQKVLTRAAKDNMKLRTLPDTDLSTVQTNRGIIQLARMVSLVAESQEVDATNLLRNIETLLDVNKGSSP